MFSANRSFYLKCVLVLLLLGIAVVTVFSVINEWKLNSQTEGFRWVRSESHFLDYQITGDTVEFRYAICFENLSENDYIISSINVEFNRAELKGWLKYGEGFSGSLDNGQSEILIKSGEKVDVVYVFSGTYLGGTVNEQVTSQSVIYVQRIARRQERQEDGSVVPADEPPSGQGDGSVSPPTKPKIDPK